MKIVMNELKPPLQSVGEVSWTSEYQSLRYCLKTIIEKCQYHYPGFWQLDIGKDNDTVYAVIMQDRKVVAFASIDIIEGDVKEAMIQLHKACIPVVNRPNYNGLSRKGVARTNLLGGAITRTEEEP